MLNSNLNQILLIKCLKLFAILYNQWSSLIKLWNEEQGPFKCSRGQLTNNDYYYRTIVYNPFFKNNILGFNNIFEFPKCQIKKSYFNYGENMGPKMYLRNHRYATKIIIVFALILVSFRAKEF